MSEERRITEEAEILLYSSDEGDIRIEVLYKNENIWLSQKRMAELFDVQRPAITKHLKNIFFTEELDENSVCSILEHTAADGKKYNTQYYSLDAIIAVGYRVNSGRAKRFRIWATSTLREFIIKGFVMDTERLKKNTRFGPDYFDELLEKIKEIRASERRFYQKITDIYAQCSIDYDPHSEITTEFYATVQNKLHWAIHGHTAAELIAERVNGSKPHMGLCTWENAPKGKILKKDVTVAKNYLTKEELDELNHIVVMYLDYAELQAKKQRVMKMKDWVKKIDAFLSFNEYDVHNDSGNISAKVAKELAEGTYSQFRITQDRGFSSEFDLLVEKVKELKKKEKDEE